MILDSVENDIPNSVNISEKMSFANMEKGWAYAHVGYTEGRESEFKHD